MKKVLYVGNFMFPDKNAAANRVVSNGRIFRALGYDVDFIGVKKGVKVSLLETKEEFDGFFGYHLPAPVGIKGWLFYRSCFQKILPYLEQEKNELEAVVMYGCPCLSLFGGLLRKWCKKNAKKIYSDAVDWLSANTGSPIYRMIKYLDTRYLKAHLYPKTDGVIAVSSYLENYYKGRGCNVVRIPPLVKKVEPVLSQGESREICNIVYAGIPFALNGMKVKKDTYKDRLDITVALFGKLQYPFRFDIYGLTEEQYLGVIPEQKELLQNNREKIIFHGSVENTVVKQAIMHADFTVFLRDKNIGTMAGFPTKFAESMCLGTPVITTDTSDLAEYLHHGENGFFLDISNQVSSLKTLEEIVLLDTETRFKMKENCAKETGFSYESYTQKMESFIEANR